MSKGRIQLLAWLHCGNCECTTPADYDFPAGDVRQAAKQGRKLGWRNTVEHGWLCPECYKVMPGQKERGNPLRSILEKGVTGESNS